MQSNTSKIRRGWLLAILGIAGFSLTLPATRVTVLHLDPWFVAFGRGVLASGLAAIALLVTRQPWPKRHQLRGLALVALGVIIGFPVLSAWAMRELPASHGGIALSVTPLATACFGAWLAGERLPGRFWIAALIGAAAVFAFAFEAGGGSLRSGDLWLFAASLLAALGYAEGARLTRILGGWQVISWALVLSVPWLLGPLCWIMAHTDLSAPFDAWAGFAYVAVISQFLAFILWYRGLAVGGIAKIGQIQLLQPFLTLGASALWLGEALSGSLLGVAAVVVTSLWVSQHSPMRQSAEIKREGRRIRHSMTLRTEKNQILMRNDHEAL
ncbi:DMT family transporter [Methylocaldum sp. BRCS4]|nr:DMT family transporter [Methylocaldum sp. BRCS4]